MEQKTEVKADAAPKAKPAAPKMRKYVVKEGSCVGEAGPNGECIKRHGGETVTLTGAEARRLARHLEPAFDDD